MKGKEKEFQELELLNLYSNKLTKEVQLYTKKKQNITRSIKRAKKKAFFKHVTKYRGRGTQKSLIRVHGMNSSNQIMKTYARKEDIESAIINCYRQHCTKAYSTNMFKNMTKDTRRGIKKPY